MKLLKKVTPLATAATLAVSAIALPTAANAELSASLGVANIYLWRGQNLTPDGGQVHGGLQYDNSGFYVGAWSSSEEGGQETDLYLGYGGEVSGFSYDVSYWNYLYPEDTADEYTTDTTVSPNERTVSAVNRGLNDTNQAEVAVSLGYGPVAVGAYINVDGDTPDDNYFTISGTWQQFTLLYGFWDLESGTVKTADSTIKGTDGELVIGEDGDPFLEGGADQYSHLTFTYAFNDALSFSVSKVFSDLDKDDPAAVNENLLFQAAYTWDFNLE
jgi:uncharacterized protein (TIGR02001 family)